MSTIVRRNNEYSVINPSTGNVVEHNDYYKVINVEPRVLCSPHLLSNLRAFNDGLFLLEARVTNSYRAYTDEKTGIVRAEAINEAVAQAGELIATTSQTLTSEINTETGEAEARAITAAEITTKNGIISASGTLALYVNEQTGQLSAIINDAVNIVDAAGNEANAAFNLASDANAISGIAESKASTAVQAATKAGTQADGAWILAATANQKADTAISEAGLAAQVATAAGLTAEGAVSLIAAADGKAGTAQSTATLASQVADTAQGTAGTAFVQADSALTRANTLENTLVLRAITDVGGNQRVAGITLSSNNIPSDPTTIVFQADKFKFVSKLDSIDETPQSLLDVDAITNQMTLNGDFIATGSISGDKITANSLNVLGVATSNRIESSNWDSGAGSGFSLASDGTFELKTESTGGRLEIVADQIKVYDSSNNLRVLLGRLT